MRVSKVKLCVKRMKFRASSFFISYSALLYFTLLLYIFKNIFHKNSTNIHAPDQHNQFVMIYAIP